mmetsp:Transcript_23943/g.29775  ORF Transcript_23943/g.29775 Transcript_23943/m.29775 type:complete len:117 (+) Transcript_23943:1-351(+)
MDFKPNIPPSEYLDDDDGQSLLSRCANCTASCICATILVNLFAFLAIFGLLNPDKEAWVGTLENGEHSMYPTEQAGSEAGATKLSDVHSKFTLWARLGFYTLLVSLLLMVLALPVY